MGVESQSRILGLFWSTPQELNIKEHCSFIFDPSQELPHFMALAQVKTIQAHQDSMHEQYIYIYTYVYIYTYIQRIYIIYINIYTYIYDITRRCSFGLEINLRKELRFIVGVWPWCKKLVVGWQRDRVAGIY